MDFGIIAFYNLSKILGLFLFYNLSKKIIKIRDSFDIIEIKV